MLNAELIRLIKAKGWLSVAELTFDNTMRITLSTTEGAICINETKNQLYTLDVSGAGGQIAFNYLMNAEVVGGDIYDLSPFYELRVYDLECLQSFAMQTWHKNGALDDIIAQGKSIQLPVVDLKTPVFKGEENNKNAKVFGEIDPSYTDMNVQNRRLFNSNFKELAIEKFGYDRFMLSQTNFKNYCKAYLALGSDILL